MDGPREKVKAEKVRVLENASVDEKLCDFMECKDIKCFANGRFTNEIQGVYQELFGMGVSAAKVRVIVCGFGENVDHLPGVPFTKRMAYEFWALSWMQLSEVLDENESLTLMSDGTSKYGHHFGAFDIRTSEGDVYLLGLRDVASGDSESTRMDFQEIRINFADGTSEEFALTPWQFHAVMSGGEFTNIIRSQTLH